MEPLHQASYDQNQGQNPQYNQPQYQQPAPQRRSLLSVPVAILIAALLIAGAIIWVNKPTKLAAVNPNEQNESVLQPVTSKDHILGNPDAKIKIVEFSDTACPFCKMFNVTMEKIMAEYGKTGNVAWVYRHFPLDKPDAAGRILHKNAGLEAQAMECAAELGGNDKFWAFESRLYAVTPSVTGSNPQGLNPAELPNIAAYVGLDKAKFNECLSSGRYKDKVQSHYIDGVNAGVAGTPYSFLITPTGQKIPINGAQPYDSLKSAIDAILASE